MYDVVTVSMGMGRGTLYLVHPADPSFRLFSMRVTYHRPTPAASYLAGLKLELDRLGKGLTDA